jgi:lysyl endopeptidase
MMKIHLLVIATAFLAASAHAESIRVDPRVQTKATTAGLAHAGKTRASQRHAVRLEAPEPSLHESLGKGGKGAPLAIGFGRDVDPLRDEASTRSALAWQPQSDGSSVAALTLTSPGAGSVRAGLRIGHLPPGTTLRFQSESDHEVYEAGVAEIEAALAEDRIYWSPLIEGDTIAIEVEVPAGAQTRDVRLSIPRLSHVDTSAAKDFVLQTKAAASCEVDAMCSAGTWSQQMNAVARMVYTKNGSTYICTGTLLADQDISSTVPYFLSANHCISTQAAASSLTTFWFYRSASCNASVAGNIRQLTGGATLLYANTTTDTSFMRLNNLPPTGTVYAGWVGGTNTSLGSQVTGLHHPSGDWLKISKGSLDAYDSCTDPSSGGFTCNETTTSNSTFYQVVWSSGVTEPGSSGSGLFRSDGLLIGQLTGGGSTCTDPTAPDVYGRFDKAYNAALKDWLSPPMETLSVAKTGAGSGTVTSGPSGIDCGPTCSAQFLANSTVTLSVAPVAGSTFAGWSGACSGTGACTVPMSSAKNVTAAFDNGPVTMSIAVTGGGGVQVSPSGIVCNVACSLSFAPGTLITLTAVPGTDTNFKGWSGACSGTAACSVTLNTATSVQAAFASKATSALTLASAANPAGLAQGIVFRAVATGGFGKPTGSVSFSADGVAIDACNAQPVSGGLATCAISTLVPGAHAIVAKYSGDAIYKPSVSASLSQTVLDTRLALGALSNLSTRGQVLTGNNVMIAGFIIGGTEPKSVAITVAGPSLAAAGIVNALANPTLTLVRSSDNTIIDGNDDWQAGANAAQVLASGFAPNDPLEPALVATLAPGAYTAIVSGSGGGTGIGLVGVFEVDHPEVPLINLATRGMVRSGEDVMIGGFVVSGDSDRSLVVRARGPSLIPFGITNPLANPTLTLVRASDNIIVGTNDNWATAANAAELIARGFAPTDALEPALLVTLTPGAYTAILSGVGGNLGVATLEVFAAP